MALSAHLEDGTVHSGKPRSARRKLRLETQGAASAAPASSVLIHNISTTGLLLESAHSLDVDERIDIDLPQAGVTQAKVIWTSGDLYGCQFNVPISAAALSATELKGAASPDTLSARSTTRAPESLGAKLQRLRDAKGLTLAQIAERLGVSKPTVWAWEKDRVRPMARRIEALAEVLGVPAQDLIIGSDASALEGLLARTREEIASAYGTSPKNVRIMIDL